MEIELVTDLPIGREDITNYLFDIWNAILLKRKQNVSQSVNKWDNIIQLYFSSKNDKILEEGIYENYLNNDITMNTSEILSNIGLLHNKINTNQIYSNVNN